MLSKQQNDHWLLVKSGKPLGRFPCIKDAARMVRNLHPGCELKSIHITDQIYELQAGTYLYTALWSLE